MKKTIKVIVIMKQLLFDEVGGWLQMSWEVNSPNATNFYFLWILLWQRNSTECKSRVTVLRTSVRLVSWSKTLSLVSMCLSWFFSPFTRDKKKLEKHILIDLFCGYVLSWISGRWCESSSDFSKARIIQVWPSPFQIKTCVLWPTNWEIYL